MTHLLGYTQVIAMGLQHSLSGVSRHLREAALQIGQIGLRLVIDQLPSTAVWGVLQCRSIQAQLCSILE